LLLVLQNAYQNSVELYRTALSLARQSASAAVSSLGPKRCGARGTCGDALAQARALLGIGDVSLRMRKDAEATDALKEAQACAIASGDSTTLISCLHGLALGSQRMVPPLPPSFPAPSALSRTTLLFCVPNSNIGVSCVVRVSFIMPTATARV
jgi:hypothetical protein